VVVADGRRGPSYVLNAGSRAATGEALAFLNDDDVVAPGWLAAIRAGLERHQAVAARVDWTALNEEWAVGPRGQPQQEAPATWWGGVGPPFGAGGTIAVRRSVHEAIGGFDEELETCEDVDYCWRLGFAGYELEFAPDAVLRMRARSTLGEIYRQARAWGEGDVALYAKHRDRLAAFRNPILSGIAGWLGVISLLAQVRGKAGAANVARHAGWRVGLVRGSVKHRVLMLSD
jgi:GT2 family glycosyltransferase